MAFHDLALIRTDDEGQALKLGLLASSEDGYALLCKTMSAQHLEEALYTLGIESIQRTETPGILALHFAIQGQPGQGTQRSDWIASIEGAFGVLLKGLKHRMSIG